jgi:hypothetical protein
MQSYIQIEQTGDTGKTLVWEVRTKASVKGEGGRFLGEIRWFGRWRGYAFYPYMDTLYEQRCMREIADFVEAQTRAKRKEWAKRRAE